MQIHRMDMMRRVFCTVSKRVTISSILNADTYCSNNEVIVEGWARSVRKMKDTVFIDITDGTGGTETATSQLQVSAAKVLVPDLTAGCSLRVRGVITRMQQQRENQLELRATALTIIGSISAKTMPPVLPRKTYSNDYLRQYLHLRHRTAKFAALARLRERAIRLLHDYMLANEFVHVHTPILTSNDCEGAGETFALQDSTRFFSKPVYLTVSSQLHLEAAAQGLGRVYTINPVFRAENSRSRLHLNEFYMLEVEQAFVTDHFELMRLIEELVTWVSGRMLELAHRDIELASDHADKAAWLNKPGGFPVLDYSEAIRILQSKGFINTERATIRGLNKEQELALVIYCGQMPTFVINWPRYSKPAFYMKENKCGKVLAVDLLVPVVGELAGGSVREDDYDALRSRCTTQNLDWYVDLRRYCGNVPSAGFGLGFERYLQFLCNISNIKDTILFPRWPHNCAM